jgi:hypothetical protein
MPKLKLKADPTFSAPVSIPLAGGDFVDVQFTFKHRTKTELDAFMQSRTGKTDTESFMDCVVSWELEEAFTAENVQELLENYIGAALATYRTYVRELCQAREKNS